MDHALNNKEPINYAIGIYHEPLRDAAEAVSAAYDQLFWNYTDHPQAQEWEEQSHEWYSKKYNLGKMFLATEEDAEKTVKEWYARCRELKTLLDTLDENKELKSKTKWLID